VGPHPQRPALARTELDEGSAHADATGPLQRRARARISNPKRKATTLPAWKALLSNAALAYEHEGAIKFKMTREPITIPDLVGRRCRASASPTENSWTRTAVLLAFRGQPVFHFVNVVETWKWHHARDFAAKDHLSNTPSIIGSFQPFGVKPPHYAHIPLIPEPRTDPR